MTKGYSRTQEYEADSYALSLLEKTGYSKVGLRDMLESLGTKAGEQGTGGWDSTHPDATDRIDELDIESDTSVGGEEDRAKRFKLILASLR